MSDVGTFAAVLIYALARLGHSREPVIAGAVRGMFAGPVRALCDCDPCTYRRHAHPGPVPMVGVPLCARRGRA